MPEKQLPAAPPASPKSNEPSSKNYFVIIIGLILLFLIALGAVIYIVLINPAEEEPSPQPAEQADATDEPSDDEAPDADGSDSAEDSEPELENLCEGVDTSMANLWEVYQNSELGFSVKHPQGLQVGQSQGDEEITVLLVSPTGSYENIAFMMWSWETDNIDVILAEEIMIPTCCDVISYEDVKYGDYTFRKAVAEDIDLLCAGANISEEQEYVSFAYEVEAGRYFILRNDGLTDDQLEAVMCTLEF